MLSENLSTTKANSMPNASAIIAAFGGGLPPGITGTNERCTLLVSNLNPERIDEDKLFNLFSLYGNIVRIKLLEEHGTIVNSKVFEMNGKKQCLVQFETEEQVTEALVCKHATSLSGSIKFFHKVGSMNTPVTDGEKLVWSVLEAERQTISQLDGKSLLEANNLFLEKHEGSLMHRAVVGEMVYILDPNRRSEAVKLIEGSTNNLVSRNGALGPIPEWRLKDCIAVHKLLGSVLEDQDAALMFSIFHNVSIYPQV